MELKNQLPLVSIGIPTYARPKNLDRMLSCITAQTYPHLEIIVSDNDAVNDESEQVVYRHMQNDSRIKYYKQSENIGPVKNYQFVLDKATGDYFIWAADDDWRAPNFISRLLNKIEGRPEVIVAFSNLRVLNESGVVHPEYKNYSTNFLPFTSKNRWSRLWNFYIQHEKYGKANIIYGLMRRKDLQDFNWCKFTNRFGFFGADMLFVYSLLVRGRLALDESILYGSTVGNVKNYESNAPISGHCRKFISFIKDIPWIKNYIQYIFISPHIYKLIVILGFPSKFLRLQLESRPRIRELVSSKLNKLRRIKNLFAGVNAENAKQLDKTSYSQCGEDIIIDHIFYWLNKRSITYLDIGTNDPVHLNNTYFFYKKSSQGVLVEPDPMLYQKIKGLRPNDICLNAGVGSSGNKYLTFYKMTPDTLSTSSGEQAKKYIQMGIKLEAEIKVPLISINHIIEEHFKYAPPDFLSVDVEGTDFEIIKSLDLMKYRPIVICVETLTYTNNNTEQKISEIADYLNEHNYFVYADTYINTIFVDKYIWDSRASN